MKSVKSEPPTILTEAQFDISTLGSNNTLHQEGIIYEGHKSSPMLSFSSTNLLCYCDLVNYSNLPNPLISASPYHWNIYQWSINIVYKNVSLHLFVSLILLAFCIEAFFFSLPIFSHISLAIPWIWEVSQFISCHFVSFMLPLLNLLLSILFSFILLQMQLGA